MRHVTLVPERPNIHDALDIATHKISSSEVERAAKKIKAGRTMDIDGIPSEFWKFLCTEDRLLQWLTNFCDHICSRSRFRKSDILLKFCALYKKGIPALPSNYRSISLLSIGHKLFVYILLNGLKNAGAEKIISRY